MVERPVVVRLFGLESLTPPLPTVREVVVAWESEQRQVGRPYAARVYVKSDREELVCAQTVLSL